MTNQTQKKTLTDRWFCPQGLINIKMNNKVIDMLVADFRFIERAASINTSLSQTTIASLRPVLHFHSFVFYNRDRIAFTHHSSPERVEATARDRSQSIDALSDAVCYSCLYLTFSSRWVHQMFYLYQVSIMCSSNAYPSHP